MEIHTEYTSVKSITYKFSEGDIKTALLQYAKLAEYDPKRALSFDLYSEGDFSNYVAIIMLKYVQPAEEP